jgi:hypothetical protein
LRNGFALEMDSQLPPALIFRFENALRRGARSYQWQLNEAGPFLESAPFGDRLHLLLQLGRIEP